MADEMMKARIEVIKSNLDDFLLLMSAVEPRIPNKGYLAGAFGHNVKEMQDRLGRRVRVGSDNFHFPMNPSFLKTGYAGIAKKTRESVTGRDEEQIEFLKAIGSVYEASARMIGRHAEKAAEMAGLAEGTEKERLGLIADNCGWLSENPPETFMQAVQLYWFTWRIRHLIGGTSTIGRLDQYLIPFYRQDAEAPDLICELFGLFNGYGSGDTLMNVMLGGQDSEGNDASNILSIMMMDASVRLSMTEPHLNARVHAGTGREYFKALYRLQLTGQGQGSIYNDEVVIPALVKHGYSLKAARNYSNDGCSEIVIDGESGIEFVQMEAVKSLETALFGGASEDSFEQVYDAFIKQYLRDADTMMDRLDAAISNRNLSGVSPAFLAGTFPECVATGNDLFRGGFTQDCFMVFSGSIPTAADSLAAIKKTVFEDGYCGMDEIRAAMKANFEGYEALRSKLLSAPKFGNDDDYADDIAADIVRRFNDHVSARSSPTGMKYMPALFNFQFIQHADRVGATPDGRRFRDPMSEHFSPTPGRARSGPTAVIRSAVKAPLAGACGTSTFFLSLSRNTAPDGAKGMKVLESLTSTALEMGVAVMNIAIYDADVLRKAKAEPEAHEDLIVRVWGYSARFVTLSSEMQDHIIARIIGG